MNRALARRRPDRQGRIVLPQEATLRPSGILAILIVALGLSGCGTIATHLAYPVVDDSPNPAPMRGYRVECGTGPGIPNLIGETTLTACRQIIPPADGGAIRTRG